MKILWIYKLMDLGTSIKHNIDNPIMSFGINVILMNNFF